MASSRPQFKYITARLMTNKICDDELYLTYLTRDFYGGEKWRSWTKSAIFFPVNNFPHHNNNFKKRRHSFLGFWGVWVMKLCTLLLICPINIFNYLVFICAINAKLHKLCNVEGSIFEKK